MPAAKLVGDKSYSILTDHLGTPYEAYDENGEKVWARELDLYGNAITTELDADLDDINTKAKRLH